MTAQLGCRSPLVLAKLGFDLRSQLKDTFSAPLPERIPRLAAEIDGYVECRDVRPPPDPAAAAPSLDLWREFVQADQPFRFS